MYAQGLSGKRIFVSEGPVRNSVCGSGSHAHMTLTELDLLLGSVTLSATGAAISAYYFIAAGVFNWESADGLLTVTNAGSAMGSGMVSSGRGKGTLIERVESTDRGFSTAQLANT